MVTMTVDVKKCIIDAALRLWKQAHDISVVSLEDIAGEAGISATTLYEQFGNRDGLVREVIDGLFSSILEKQKAIVETDRPFPEKIQSLISAKMAPLEGIVPDLVEKLCTDPVARERVQQMTETKVKPMVSAIIRQGKQEGYISTELPDEVIMLYFEVLKSGRMACPEEMKQVVADKGKMLAFVRLVYFGLFQKKFDINLDATTKGP